MTTTSEDDGGLDPRTPTRMARWSHRTAHARARPRATTTQLPVDIVWIVDNSASMLPAIVEVTAGLDDFAALIASKNLDYRVIVSRCEAPRARS